MLPFQINPLPPPSSEPSMMTVFRRSAPREDYDDPQAEHNENAILEDIGEIAPPSDAASPEETITAKQLKEFIEKHVVDSQNLLSDEEDEYESIQSVENEFDDIQD